LWQLHVGSVLEHEPGSARGDRTSGERGGVVHREHDDPRADTLPAQPIDHVDARSIVHPEIEHEHVRSVVSEVTHDGRNVCRLGDHPYVILTIEHQMQAAAHSRMLVGEHDPDRPRGVTHAALGPDDPQVCAHTDNVTPAGARISPGTLQESPDKYLFI